MTIDIAPPGVLEMIWQVFLDAAPFVLLGLFLAGWLKVLIRSPGVDRYLGRPNLRSAVLAWLLGAPLPVCSCGVVPVALGLRSKGASRESLLSFLIGTPETSVGTVMITWGLLGPVMAVVRPLASLATSLLAAVLSIAARTDEPTDPAPEADGTEASPDEEDARPPVPLRGLVRNALHHGFVEMLDDISVWLVVGIAAAGLLAGLVPADWLQRIPGGELGGMLLVLLASIPIYACAVETTPIAAVLILKGLSPGAALVLLLAGPATNVTTLVLLGQHFGRRFVGIYLTAVALGSVGMGLALNAVLGATALDVTSRVSATGATAGTSTVGAVSAVLLLALLGSSLCRVDWRGELSRVGAVLARLLEIAGVLVPGPDDAGLRLRPSLRGRRPVALGLLLALAGYGATGLYQVPPGHTGYETRLGRLTATDLPPGLHVHLPWPFEAVKVLRSEEVRKTDLGFRTDLELLKRWMEIPGRRTAAGWHSFFTTMHVKPRESVYVLGDENQLEAKTAVHYRIRDPRAFFFDYAGDSDLVALTTESVLRRFMASQRIDQVLTATRGRIAQEVVRQTQALLDEYGIGVEVLDVFVVDLHPPVEAIPAFRSVASAMEDRETRIHRAHESRSASIPISRGRAAKVLAAAEAGAVQALSDGRGRAESFSARARVFSAHRPATNLRVHLEALERVLPGVPKVIVPPEVAQGGRLGVWTGTPQVAAEISEPGY